MEEVKEWEQTLREELDGLKYCREKVQEDTSIPKNIQSRILEVIRTLKMNMVQVMAKCAQLRKEGLPQKAFNARADRLRQEYLDAIKNLQKLLSTVESPKRYEPNFTNDTFSSRNKHSPVTKKAPRPKSASQETTRKVSPKSSDPETKLGLQKLENDLKNHIHIEYEERIEKLERENTDLKKQLSYLQEEHSEVLESLHSLKLRLDKLENKQTAKLETPSPNNSAEKPEQKPRFLIKPTYSAEKLLRGNAL